MDHLVVTWVLLSLLAFERAERSTGRARLRWAAACGALAGFGVLTKIVPGLCVLAAIALWLRSDARDRFRCVLACSAALGLVVVGVNTAFYAWAGERYLETYRYHALRGVQIESLYSGLLMLLKPFGLALRVDESFGSTNLASAATPIIKPLSLLLLATAIGYVLLRRRFSDDARGALALSVILLLLFMLTNRVFSPQYTIWVAAPLALLAVLSPESRRQYGAFVALALLSQLIFPRGYPVLKALHPVAIALLNLRNLGLVALCVSLVRAHSTPVAQSLFNR
jgi:4-amino-4-deoxy-L-arabinose transferase-like glycosyltransferase